MNEKTAQSAPTGQAENAASAKPKKKGGFLSFLCCGSRDEGQEGASEAAQAPKPVDKPQPTRAQQHGRTKQHQDVNAPDTSAADSREAFDEKAAAPFQHDTPNNVTSTDREKSGPGDATADRTGPFLSSGGSPSVQNNPEVRPLDEGNQPMVPADPTTGPPVLNTSGANYEPLSSNPEVNVQAPTPVVPQQSSAEQLIQDRPPNQKAMDDDIEMADADQHDKPSLPLSTKEVAGIAAGGAVVGGVAIGGEELHQRESSHDPQTTLPPPPPPGPPPQTQPEVARATDSSNASSIASERDESHKWLLPPLRSEHKGRKCLVLDLDETLVHSSFKVSFKT